MKAIQNNATKLRPQGIRNIDADMVAINLPFYIAEIKKEKTWACKDKNAITVFKTNALKIVLMVLKMGAELKECIIPSLFTFQVLEGAITFITPYQTVSLGIGEIITLHKNIGHSIFAKEESAFLITIIGI